jgi:hypothetical protein
LEHFPEKWVPVFRKKMRPMKIWRGNLHETARPIKGVGPACAGAAEPR